MGIFGRIFETILLALILLFMIVLLGVMKVLLFIDKHLFCTCRAVEAVYGLMDKLAAIFGAQDQN